MALGRVIQPSLHALEHVTAILVNEAVARYATLADTVFRERVLARYVWGAGAAGTPLTVRHTRTADVSGTFFGGRKGIYIYVWDYQLIPTQSADRARRQHAMECLSHDVLRVLTHEMIHHNDRNVRVPPKGFSTRHPYPRTTRRYSASRHLRHLLHPTEVDARTAEFASGVFSEWARTMADVFPADAAAGLAALRQNRGRFNRWMLRWRDRFIEEEMKALLATGIPERATFDVHAAIERMKRLFLKLVEEQHARLVLATRMALRDRKPTTYYW